MPNDPRVKFKKRIYDPSRNLMYEERTGGGGGNPPGGGGYVPPSVIPDNPYNPPPPHDDPSVPTDFPTYFKPTIVPFDPYQRRITERGDRIRDKMIVDENARLKVKPLVKPQVITRPKSGVLDDMLPVDEDSGTIPKDITGPFQPMKNQFGLKFKITPIDQRPKIPRSIDANPTGTQLQDLGDDLEKQLKGQNKLTSDLDTLSGETIAKRVSQMQAEGKSQDYIDAVVKIIRRNQATKARKAAFLTPEEHIELLEITLKNPNSSAAEIAKVKSTIARLKTEIKNNLDLAKPKVDLIAQGAKLQQKINDANADLAKPNTPAQEKYLKTQRTKAQNDLIKLQGDPLDIQKATLQDKMAKIDNEISIASNQDQVAILEKQKVEIQKNLKALEDFGTQPAKPTASAQAPAKSFETIKATLEGKIMNINEQISKSNNLRKNAQLVRQRKTLEQQLAVVENNLKTVQKTQQIIDNAKQYAKNVELIKAGKTPPPPPPKPSASAGDVAPPARSADSIRVEQRLAKIRDVATPDYLNLPPAPAPAPAQPEEGEMQEMGSLAAKNHIAEFENLVDTLVQSAKESGFKVPEAPESIQAEGELAVKKYVYEQALEFAEANNIFLSEYAVEKGVLKPTGKAKSKTDQLKVLDEFYQRAVSQQASQPVRPSQRSSSSSSSVRRPTGTPPASAPASPPEFAPHEDWVDINRGTQAPTAPKPADVMARLNEQFGSGSGSRQGTGSARADSILDTLDAIDSNLPPAGTRPPKGSTGGDTPAYSPNPSQRTSQRRQGETQPMEMDTVPLIDSAPGSARPSARGKAKIKAPPSSTPAPKPKFNFGRTDMNIQGRLNINVASEFTNSVAGKFGSSLRGLSSRVPTLKAPSVNTIKRVGVEGGKMGAGIVVGIGVSYLMAQYFKEHPATDRYSQIGQQYAIGFSGAAAGNIVMRALAIAGRMGAKKVLSTTGMKVLVVESAYATRDAALFVAAQLAVEIGVEALMDRYKFNHTTSKTTAAVAGSGVAIAMGFREGGPYGAVLMAAFSAASVTEAWFEGQEEDRNEEENKRQTAETANKVNSARMQLVKNMEYTNNDYDKAYAMLSNKQREHINLVGEEGALRFKNSLSVEFNPLEKERHGNPYLPKDPEPDPIEQGFWNGVEWLAYTSPAFMLLDWNEKTFQANEKREQEAKDKYYQAYVEWYIKKKKEVISSPPPAEDEGFRLLERDTLGSWRTSAEFSGELAYQQTENYNRVVNNARQQVLNEWRGNMTTLDELRARDQAGRDLVETAGLDESFYNDYETWVIQDATSQLAVQFNHFGINYRDADAKLVAVAGRDPSVLPALDKYYEVMTQLSKETNLPIAELARLDALPQDQQERELGKVNALREQVIRAGLLSDKALVDEFNANLIRDMQSYGNNFEEIMRNINDQQMLMGYSYLYGTTRTDFYNQLHLEAPVVVIPPNPYAGSTEFDYNKNRTPYDTLIYGYRYNLTDEQNQELEEYLYTRNRELMAAEGRQVTMDEVLERANFIYDRDRPIYRKSDEEVAKEQNMTLEEYYAEYGYDMDKKPPVEPILWQDITEREIPPTSIFAGQDESDEGAGERQANADLQASRIAGGGSADEFDRMAAGAYAAQQRALVDAQGGNNIAGDQPQQRTNENGETLRQENDPDGP